MAKVLIIEDDPAQIELLTTAFTAYGHEVFSAKTAVGGLEYANSEHPDVIILDEILSDMEGTDVLKKLKSEGEKTINIPVIMYTAFSNPVVEKDALELGATKFLYKFLTTPEKLNATIQEVLTPPAPQAT